MNRIALHRARLRDATIAALRAHLTAHPPAAAARVVLFGSVARGDFDGASDLDVLVIGEHPPGSALHAVVDRAVEVLLWPPGRLEAALAARNPFAEALRREGVELWRAPGLPPLGD